MVYTEVVIMRDRARPVPPQPNISSGAILSMPWPSDAVAREYEHWLNHTVGEKWTSWQWRSETFRRCGIWLADPAMASWFILRWGLDNVNVVLL